MISLLVKYYICKEAKRLKKSVPKNYKAILQKYIDMNPSTKYKVFFSWTYDSGSPILNASAALPGCIIFNAAWAARIIFYDSPDTKNAFLITLGHELAHKEGNLCRYISSKNKIRFFSWINEVYADFRAAELMQKSRKDLLLAIDYKKSLRKQDKDTFYHPSWSKRRYYAENYNFTNELVDQIANDTECKNKRSVSKVCDFFKDIYLL